MEKKDSINVKCFRFDPKKNEKPYYDTFEVPLNGTMSVQDCLTYIRENLDPSLAFFINCRLGFCKRCLVKVNGKSCLACLTEVEEDFLIEPVLKNKVIRDLWIKDL
ncbi:MAG: 2Fe-2S iron-sulfur cluster-binding protein [Promethearchaeota archaeon]|jgi:succinate dehydrogenase/fumarate reductase iron-sulfur protein